jgi:hypothetical protein
MHLQPFKTLSRQYVLLSYRKERCFLMTVISETAI